MSHPFDPPEVDPAQLSLTPEAPPPVIRGKRAGPYSLELSPCVMCNAYRACIEQAAHGWGFCSIHNEFMRGNGCCGAWDPTGKT